MRNLERSRRQQRVSHVQGHASVRIAHVTPTWEEHTESSRQYWCRETPTWDPEDETRTWKLADAMYGPDTASSGCITSRYRHIPVWRAYALNITRNRRYQRNAKNSTTHTHTHIIEPIPARNEQPQETRYQRNRGERRGDAPTRESTARNGLGSYALEGASVNEIRTDLRRLARHAMIRRGHLDGERIHPHPGMPRGNQPKQTALALNIPGRWRTETRAGSKYFIYRHSAGDDIRFRENTVTFPDGSTGTGPPTPDPPILPYPIHTYPDPTATSYHPTPSHPTPTPRPSHPSHTSPHPILTPLPPRPTTTNMHRNIRHNTQHHYAHHKRRGKGMKQQR